MFDSLLWVLYHFVTHYSGQTTQGDKNGVDQASGSKDATSSLQGTTPTTLPTTLQEGNTPDQSGASSSADPQSEKDCTGGHGIRRVSKSCPQPPSPPGSQPSTLHVLPKPGEMTLPVYLGKSEAKPYLRGQKTSQYDAFIASEIKYYKLEYSRKRKLGEGGSGKVYLATRNSDGMKVAYKSISYKDVDDYTLEPSPPPICHLRNSLVPSEETSVAQCMSSRPPNLLLSYELLLQMYLSRPGHENPYVPTTFDYITLKKKGKERPDIVDARDIIKKIVEAMIHLKQYGILHNDVNDENVMYNPETGEIKLIDFDQFAILPGWEAGKSLPLKSPDLSSTSPDYKAGADELWSHYGPLAADTTGHSLDLQYWHDRQPIQVSPNTPPIRNSDILDQDFSWNQIAAALLQMSPRKAPGDDGITTAFYQAALYTPANIQEGVPPTPFSRALLRVCGQVFASATILRLADFPAVAYVLSSLPAHQQVVFYIRMTEELHTKLSSNRGPSTPIRPAVLRANERAIAEALSISPAQMGQASFNHGMPLPKRFVAPPPHTNKNSLTTTALRLTQQSIQRGMENAVLRASKKSTNVQNAGIIQKRIQDNIVNIQAVIERDEKGLKEIIAARRTTPSTTFSNQDGLEGLIQENELRVNWVDRAQREISRTAAKKVEREQEKIIIAKAISEKVDAHLSAAKHELQRNKELFQARPKLQRHYCSVFGNILFVAALNDCAFAVFNSMNMIEIWTIETIDEKEASIIKQLVNLDCDAISCVEQLYSGYISSFNEDPRSSREKTKDSTFVNQKNGLADTIIPSQSASMLSSSTLAPINLHDGSHNPGHACATYSNTKENSTALPLHDSVPLLVTEISTVSGEHILEAFRMNFDLEWVCKCDLLKLTSVDRTSRVVPQGCYEFSGKPISNFKDVEDLHITNIGEDGLYSGVIVALKSGVLLRVSYYPKASPKSGDQEETVELNHNSAVNNNETSYKLPYGTTLGQNVNKGLNSLEYSIVQVTWMLDMFQYEKNTHISYHLPLGQDNSPSTQESHPKGASQSLQNHFSDNAQAIPVGFKVTGMKFLMNGKYNKPQLMVAGNDGIIRIYPDDPLKPITNETFVTSIDLNHINKVFDKHVDIPREHSVLSGISPQLDATVWCKNMQIAIAYTGNSTLVVFDIHDPQRNMVQLKVVKEQCGGVVEDHTAKSDKPIDETRGVQIIDDECGQGVLYHGQEWSLFSINDIMNMVRNLGE
ncbi:hypothetical protein BASA83_011400 [Batrachochytrium salamandrivorans]|nr:hypothetical protein BASA83_011400 [Batrachochytrium salamandrivorans]